MVIRLFMRIGQVWVKEDSVGDCKAVKLVITNPADEEEVLFEAGPYMLQNLNMVTHEKLIGCFCFQEHIHGD